MEYFKREPVIENGPSNVELMMAFFALAAILLAIVWNYERVRNVAGRFPGLLRFWDHRRPEDPQPIQNIHEIPQPIQEQPIQNVVNSQRSRDILVVNGQPSNEEPQPQPATQVQPPVMMCQQRTPVNNQPSDDVPTTPKIKKTKKAKKNIRKRRSRSRK